MIPTHILHIANAIVVALGAPGFCLAMCDAKSYQRVGVVLGVLTIPAWWVIAIQSNQWGLIVMQAVYTAGWVIKLRSVMKS